MRLHYFWYRGLDEEVTVVATEQVKIAGHRKALPEAAGNSEASHELAELAQLAEEITGDLSELAELAEDLADVAEQAVRAARIGARKGKLRLLRRNSREDED